jgi:hypothetical protein
MPSIVPIKFATAPVAVAGLALVTASVLHEQDGRILVRLDDARVLRARRSKGCLVKPETGDLVLAVDTESGQGVFIIDVLTGAGSATRLSVKGDLAMEADGGELSLSGRQVTVAPREAVAIHAPLLALEGDEGRLRFRNVSLLSRFLSVSVWRAATVCDRLDMTVRHAFQRLKNIFRRIEGLEETRAGRISVHSEAGVDVRGGRVSVISDEDVKIDGRGIHIG